MADSLVETHALTRYYGPQPALLDCTLSLPPAEVFGLLGPNGSGKTTLVRLLLGFLKPTSGTARIQGRDTWRDAVEVHRLVGYLPGEARLYRRMTGRALLSFFCRLRQQNPASALALAQQLRVELDRPAGTLSTGMRQKLALALALSAPVPLLILDEPTSNLDPSAREQVLALVQEARARGQTVLFSSHVLEEVERSCDRVAILREGRLVHLQGIAELRRRHRIRARLTGPLPPVPPALAGGLTVHAQDHSVTLETASELACLLSWLATLPMTEVRIEPLGLRAVYEQFHGVEPSHRGEPA
jgi:ABC-2 type transport system ATP-binding protein